jgi:dTMP kinase
VRGFLISFEGGEGTGKTTQAAMLVEALRQRGISVVAVREPGGTRLGEAVREIFLSVDHHDLSPWAEANLVTGARAQLLKEVIIPEMARGTVIVADRFSDSTLAYQGAGRGLEMGVLIAMQLALKVKPDLTFLLDLEVEEGLRRHAATAGRSSDRMEREDVAFHERVRQGYLDFARRDPERYFVIGAAAPREEIGDRVLDVTLQRTAAHGVSPGSMRPALEGSE